jgi:hypothetical protein
LYEADRKLRGELPTNAQQPDAPQTAAVGKKKIIPLRGPINPNPIFLFLRAIFGSILSAGLLQVSVA